MAAAAAAAAATAEAPPPPAPPAPPPPTSSKPQQQQEQDEKDSQSPLTKGQKKKLKNKKKAAKAAAEAEAEAEATIPAGAGAKGAPPPSSAQPPSSFPRPASSSHRPRTPRVDPIELGQRLLRCEARIVDFGNACWTHKQFTSDIQTRQYRSPEVRFFLTFFVFFLCFFLSFSLPFSSFFLLRPFPSHRKIFPARKSQYQGRKVSGRRSEVLFFLEGKKPLAKRDRLRFFNYETRAEKRHPAPALYLRRAPVYIFTMTRFRATSRDRTNRFFLPF